MSKEIDENGLRKPKAVYTVPEYFGVLDQLDEVESELAQTRDQLIDAQDDVDYYKSLVDLPEPKDDGLKYIHAKDIDVDLNQTDFVQGILGHGQFSVIYGESNCGKTFFMTDLCFHIALGQEWRGRRVEGGGVVYVAMEGSIGLKKRVAAFRSHYGKNPEGFVMVPSQVDFMDPHGNIKEFVGLLEVAKRDLGSIRIVVIDTLARAIAGGDENSGQDMGMLVKHADMIRSKTGAHVCFIHHSGKDALRGMRGHSSLKAAIDTEIEISRANDADFSTVRVIKQREMEKGQEMAFELHKVVLGVNPYGEEVSSCVVMYHEVEEKAKRADRLTAHEQFVYDCLMNAIIDRGVERAPGKGYDTVKCVEYSDLTVALEQAGYKELYNKDGMNKTKDVTNAVRMSLRKKGYMWSNTRYLWVIEK
jgi:RecA-family ATPase